MIKNPFRSLHLLLSFPSHFYFYCFLEHSWCSLFYSIFTSFFLCFITDTSTSRHFESLCQNHLKVRRLIIWMNLVKIWEGLEVIHVVLDMFHRQRYNLIQQGGIFDSAEGPELE